MWPTARKRGEYIFFWTESTANTEWKLSASPRCFLHHWDYGTYWAETTECQGKSSTEIQWLKPDPHAKFIKVSPSSLHPIQYFAQLYRERTNCLPHLCSLSLETPWRGYTGKPDYNSSSWSTLGPGPVEKLKATDPHPRKVHTPKHLVKFKTPHGILSSQLVP